MNVTKMSEAPRNVSNVSSRCLYHRVARRVSTESRAPAARRARGKRRRAARRVNYRESVWGKQQISSQMITGGASEKEMGPPKYYKPSGADISEKSRLDNSKLRVAELRNAESVAGTVYQPSSGPNNNVNSEEEIFNTMLEKVRRTSSAKKY